MQKKLLGMAVAAALAAPAAAFAQAAGSGLQIYGVIDFQAMHQKFDDAFANAAGPSNDVSKTAVHSSASRIGFRGRESLGGGMSAWFQAEMGITAGRSSVDFSPNGVNWLGGRDTAVGLDSSWGTVMVGSWGSPYKVTGLQSWNLGTYGIVSHYGLIMNNGDTTGTEGSPNCGPVTCGAGFVEGANNRFGRRLANTVQYWSPKFSGFQFKVATEMSSLKTTDAATAPDSDPTLWSFSLTWGSGPFFVGAAYETHEGFTATGAAGAPTDPKDKAWQLGGKWDFGAGSVAAGIEKLEFDNISGTPGAETDFERWNYIVNATYNLGAGQLYAGYSWTPGNKNCGAGLEAAATAIGESCKEASKADFLSLGYAHNLSKRTKAYVNLGFIDNGPTTTYYYIAGPAGNAGGGTSGGVIAGTDVRTVGVGIQHSF